MANLDIVNLAVGGVLGGVIGYGANRMQQIAERPRVKASGFLKRTPQYEGGDLYKIWIMLGGRRGPGASAMEITYTEPGCAPISCFAKFDEAPKPFSPDGTYWPHMVPLSYQQILHIGRIYTVPLLHMSDAGLYIFNGWWHGRGAASYTESVFKISDIGILQITLSGEGLSWHKKVKVSDLITNAPSAPLADSGDKQATVKSFVETQLPSRRPYRRHG